MAATRGISQLLRRTLHNHSSSVSIQSAYNNLLFFSHKLGTEASCDKTSPCAIIIWNLSELGGGGKQILLNIAFLLAEKIKRVSTVPYLHVIHLVELFCSSYLMLLYSFKMDMAVYCF
jgi:hypothetical protein